MAKELGLGHKRGRTRTLFQKRVNEPAVPFELGGPVFVRRTVRVLTAIDFDHEGVPRASKVDNELADRVLPAKLLPQQAAI